MNNKFNTQALEKLIQNNKEDKDILDMIFDVIKSFEEYHRSIVDMEIKLHIYSSETLDREEYQDMVTELDRRRTMCHDSVLTGMNVINRIAEKQKVEPIYSGTISKEKPYRREVANAVLDYIQTIIENRR